MSFVKVRVTKSYEDHGARVPAGAVVLIPALDAVALAQRGYVSLALVLGDPPLWHPGRSMAADPPSPESPPAPESEPAPDPAPVPDPEEPSAPDPPPTDPPTPRRSRTRRYERRDLEVTDDRALEADHASRHPE